MVFPLQDEPQTLRLTPWVTRGLVAINVLVLLVELAQGPHLENFLRQYAVIPAVFTHPQDLSSNIPFPYWMTLFSSMFLHGGWLHLLANMLYLRIFGDNIESAMGHGGYLLFYLACGVAGAWSHIALNPTSTIPSLGASGAIAGILGSYLLLYPKNRVQVATFYGIIEVSAFWMIGLWIILQLVSGLAILGSSSTDSGIAYSAHVGGFLAGVLLTLLLRPKLSQV